MRVFLDAVFSHLLIATVITVILWVLGAVMTTSVNFFEWSMDARIFCVVLSNLAAVFVQIGLREEEAL